MGRVVGRALAGAIELVAGLGRALGALLVNAELGSGTSG